jgi:hypothetical protein
MSTAPQSVDHRVSHLLVAPKNIAEAALLQAPSIDWIYANGRGAIVLSQGSNELSVNDVEKANMGIAYLDLIVAKCVGH